MNENNWKWVDGYENMYRIYKDGRVESVKRKWVPNNRFFEPQISNSGYLRIELSKDGEQKKFSIHRLLAIAFIPNPNPDKFDCVDHINQDRLDNSIKNLRWISVSGNQRNQKNRGKYLKGVCWDKGHNKFKAAINIDGKCKNLGRFDDEKEAGKAYMEKYNETMKEFEKL